MNSEPTVSPRAGCLRLARHRWVLSCRKSAVIEGELEQSGRLRVVVVDSDEAMRLLLQLQLELDGRFEVVGEGAEGSEAVELADTHQPDLIVMPLYLSGTGTAEAIQEVRRRAPGHAVAAPAHRRCGSWRRQYRGRCHERSCGLPRSQSE